jgi:hypothetical protein
VHILVLLDVYVPRFNGVSTSIETFREDIQSLGRQCTVVAPECPHETEEPDDGDIVRVPSWRVPFDPEVGLLVWPRMMAWAATLGRGAFDVIHVQTPFSAHYALAEASRSEQSGRH